MSNILISLVENGLVAGAVWMVLAHPLLALGAGLVAVVVAVTLTVWLARRARRAVGRLWHGRAADPPGAAGAG